MGHFVHLAEEAGMVTAERFLTNAQASFNLLATHAFMGSPLPLRRPELAGLRKWRVDGFDNFVIFYIPRHDGMSVVRVHYGARDWWNLFRPR